MSKYHSKNLKTKNKVTVVIPTFNRCNYVTKAIDSCLKQTQPCNIIVCDHGSKDETPKILKERYKNKVKYIRREEDFGPHYCWLDGVMHAETEYVKLLFDDDWLEPTFIEKSLPLMSQDVSCVITNAKIFDETKNKIKNYNFLNKETGIYKNSLIKKRFLSFKGVISPTSCLFRKQDLIDGIYQGKLLKKGGNYYHGVGPDMFVMLLGFLRYSKVGIVNENLSVFRAHTDSITIDSSKNIDKKIKISKAYEDVVEFYSFLRLFPLFKKIYFLNPYKILRESFKLKIKSFIDK